MQQTYSDKPYKEKTNQNPGEWRGGDAFSTEAEATVHQGTISRPSLVRETPTISMIFA
jgi:hypothetical protein